jgi:5'-nucleotidase
MWKTADFALTTEGEHMLIGLDMDGVMADWDGFLDEQLDAVPELHDFPRQPERGWNSFSDADPRHKKAVYKILEHPEYYSSLKPIEGAVAAANQMRSDDHDVVFISSPWESNPMGYQAKANWLFQHFGGWARKNLILTSDKTLVIADVLVDDKPVIKGRRLDLARPLTSPLWQRVIFAQSYNEDIAGPRIENWTDGSWKDVLYGLEGNL